MERGKITPAMEDYLKGVYLLRERGEMVTGLALAQLLGVKPPSVTGMVKRLAALGMLRYTSYHPIDLTTLGEAVALEIVRHHRLLELYLAEFLGMPWEDVHAEADRLEHHISEELEERIAARLGQPTFDPHGDPIPSRELVVPARAVSRLTALQVGHRWQIARIERQQPDVLQYLESLGLVPGAAVRVLQISPFGGVVTLAVRAGDGTELTQAIGLELAEHILAAPLPGERLPA